MRMLIKLFKIILFLFTLLSNEINLAQTILPQVDDIRLNNLIQNVESKSKKHRYAFFSEYQHNFKYTIESEERNEKKEWGYEQFCLNGNRSYCRVILVEKDDIPLPESKIKKAREKVSKDLIKNENFVATNDPFGFGTSLSSIWIDPSVYLRDCQIITSSEKNIAGRSAIWIRLNNCNVDKESDVWKKQILYVPKTEAEILIDEKDESVMQMLVYVKKEFSLLNTDKPIITMENTRMPEGYWLFKKIRLETIGNKLVFPDLKDNFEYEFFDYKQLKVDVNEVKSN